MTKPINEILIPSDWAKVVPGGGIFVKNNYKPEQQVVNIYLIEDRLKHDFSRPLCSLSASPESDDGLAEFRLPADLPAGKYVARIYEDGIGGYEVGFFIDPDKLGFINKFAPALRSGAAVDRPTDNGPLFSIITTVYDTPHELIAILADHLDQQTCDDFEWLLLDNGSTNPATRERIIDIASRQINTRCFRVEDNLHIIGGNRFLLEKARGRYIVPIDSDDCLFPNSLALIAEHLQNNPADMVFTDEVKVSPRGEVLDLIWRPTYSRISAMSTCPASHLMAFSRRFALTCEVYGDDAARGSHDWDTFLRLVDAGATVEQVREPAYGWRMHSASSALSSNAKDYLFNSQLNVIKNSLLRRGLAKKFKAVLADHHHIGYFNLKRLHVAPPPVEIDLMLIDGQATSLANVCATLRATRYPNVVRVRVIGASKVLSLSTRKSITTAAVASGFPEPTFIKLTEFTDETVLCDCETASVIKVLTGSSGRVTTADWIWEMVGTLELDDKVAVVGGAVLGAGDKARLHAGWIGELDGFAASPLEMPEFCSYRHAVTGVWGGTLGIRCSTIELIGMPLGVDGPDGLNGLEYGLRCRRHGLLTAYHPGIVTEAAIVAPGIAEDNEELAALIQERYPELQTTDPYYNRYLSLDSQRAGLLRAAPDEKVSAKPLRSSTTLPGQGVVKPVRPYQLGDIPDFPCMNLMQQARPLNFKVRPRLSRRPMLNVIIPGLAMQNMSGGPNTAINIAYRLAMQGIPVRFIASCMGPDPDMDPLRNHIMKLAGTKEWLPNVEVCSGADRATEVEIGERDVFLATAWWTAQIVICQLPQMRVKQFFYLIQDFEPVLHPASTLQAMAMASYSANFIPIVNHAILYEYFVTNRVGAFADRAVADNAIVFMPAIDRQLFYPVQNKEPGKRRLLFYARQSIGLRNLFELGTLALHVAAMRGLFEPGEWEICGMGEAFAPVRISDELTLEPLPWRNLESYGTQMREADILLSLMMAPHPSYPPLEMAACGGMVVTNHFGTKSVNRMSEVSPNILVAELDVESIVAALASAVERSKRSRVRQSALQGHPSDWTESFGHVIEKVIPHWRQLTQA